ncbi:MAG: hypothetical protein ABJF11_03155 [Reichenbachiella sp.]|uniref:hypothetical protein n=1 Tax=Reichenbachiella sp. TaxID=2184521 RepID=UPI0032673D84
MKHFVFAFCFNLCAGNMFLFAQNPKYPCQYEGNQILEELLGSWKVETKDRVSPGQYEINVGISTITTGIQGCSIKENYKGIYKSKVYAVESTLLMVDSMKLQRVYFDSEHASTMVFNGETDGNDIKMLWLRNNEKKRMRVKFELTRHSADAFEWSTHLSTDYGESWQLTHLWKYNRVTGMDVKDIEHKEIKQAIDSYHLGLSSGQVKLVTDAISDQFIMFNGNYSGEPLNWQAHMFLSGKDLNNWPSQFIAEAGPYQNQYEIISIHIRANAAVVITRDTGSNKFRAWKNERTTWLLGKKDQKWQITGYYLRDMVNP